MPPRTRKSLARKAKSVNEEHDDVAATAHEPETKPASEGTTANASKRKHEPNHEVTRKSVAPDTEQFEIPYKEKSILCERRTCSSDSPLLVFTHGAGGGLETPAMQLFAEGFSSKANVVSFKGNMNMTSRIRSFGAVVTHVLDEPGTVSSLLPLALGGRSMGARAAVMAATDNREEAAIKGKVNALVLVSYPLLAGGKGDTTKNDEGRTQILLDLPGSIDVLFVSGSKDSMGPLTQLDEVRQRMKATSWMAVVEGADHGMGWKGTAKKGEEELRRKTGAVAAQWVKDRDRSKRHCSIAWNEDNGTVECSDWTEGGEDLGQDDKVIDAEVQLEPKPEETMEVEQTTSKPPSVKRRKQAR